MPEGPELHLTSKFINRVCQGRVFGKIHKSEISKNPSVTPPGKRFLISATSRGKEIKLTLSDADCSSEKKDEKAKSKTLNAFKPLDIMFTFGLAGKFEFYEATELMKHAHLNFYTADKQQDMVLSFVDYMRFGKWTPNTDFSYKDRGPCVLTEYKPFRENVLQNLASTAFNKPICEALLNQRYFNGIGNYLRAEILHRLKIPPFVSARSVLEPLSMNNENGICVKSENPDILQLCSILPNEVVELEGSWYDGKDRDNTTNNFNSWLQCYYKDGMKNISDHNKRTIWYSGPLGPMAPKDGVMRGKKKGKSRANKDTAETEIKNEEDEQTVKPTKRKSGNKQANSNSKKKKMEENDILEIKSETAYTGNLTGSPKHQRITRSRVKKGIEDKALSEINSKETDKLGHHENGMNGVIIDEESKGKATSRKRRNQKK